MIQLWREAERKSESKPKTDTEGKEKEIGHYLH